MEIMNVETLKIVDGYFGYSVSNFGNVFNNKTNRKLKSFICGRYYAVTLYKDGLGKTYNIHKLVAIAFLENPKNKPCVDHIDNNKLNNNLSNLRYATHFENNRNAKKTTKETSSIYKGVSFNKNIKKYQAQIGRNGKNMYLGIFDNEKEAAKSYNKKAIELFGEFAHLNIIEN